MLKTKHRIFLFVLKTAYYFDFIRKKAVLCYNCKVKDYFF
jgi:hypothetical protein